MINLNETNSRIAKKNHKPFQSNVDTVGAELEAYAAKKTEDEIVNVSVTFIVLGVVFGGLYYAWTILPF